MTVELVDRKGGVVADLGRQTPTAGGFPTLARAVTVAPRAPLDLVRNRCGSTLRITNQRSGQLAAQSVCLNGS